jgi:hypothetical protein
MGGSMAARTPEQRRKQEVAKVLRALLYYDGDTEPFLSVKAALGELKNAAPETYGLVWKVYVYADLVGLAEKRAAADKLKWFVRQLPADLDLALPARSEDGEADPDWGAVSFDEGERVETDGEGEDWSDAITKDLLYGDSRIQDDQRVGVAHIEQRGSGYKSKGKRKIVGPAEVYWVVTPDGEHIERVTNICNDTDTIRRRLEEIIGEPMEEICAAVRVGRPRKGKEATRSFALNGAINQVRSEGAHYAAIGEVIGCSESAVLRRQDRYLRATQSAWEKRQVLHHSR